MDQLDELEKRVNELVSELTGIIERLRKDIADTENEVSFNQVKEIEHTINRLKRRGLPVPPELNALKINLLSDHELYKERVDLYRKIQERIGGLLQRGQGGTIKGNKNLEDYLIPVIRLMWDGLDHKAAFRRIAQKLDVRYNTVSSQCTRALDLTMDEFIRQVESKSIVDLLKHKYPGQHELELIKAELGR
ncbi:MAG: hypothetical protein QM301_12180 [Bacteroidota bacterium]|nr:hypothetical protein [Bacteroidota bacterium]